MSDIVPETHPVTTEIIPASGTGVQLQPAVPEAVAGLPPTTPDTARGQLATLAKPSDSLSELGATKDEINTLLERGSQFLLDAKDSRILLTALARQAGATPLGIEIRRNALIMLRDHPPEKGNTIRHKSLKTAIGAILPNNTNENSLAFLSFLEGEQANLTGPDQKKVKLILDALRGGDLNASQVMAHYLNNPDEQAASIRNHLMQAIGGEREKPLNLRTADDILLAAHLSPSSRNKAKLKDAMTERHPKDMHTLMIGVEMGVLLFMLFSQMIQEGEGRSQGQH